MTTLVHASDVHFGKPFRPAAAEAFLEAVERLRPDAVVVSGDFTQRAKVHEFEQAAAFLARLAPLPVVVTPGNHDVPLYRVFERLSAPHRNYRRYICDELDTVTRIAGATFVALDSSEPYRAIVNGHLSRRQMDFARETFRASPEDDLRIVVTHHNLAPAPDYDRGPAVRGAGRALRAFAEMGVELVLSGHLHRAYLTNAYDVLPKSELAAEVVIVHSGTTTSSRGRVRERAENSFNLIQVHARSVEVTRYMRFFDTGDFEPFAFHRVPRPGAGRLEMPVHHE